MDNKNKSSVLQWLIPTGIMMVVVIAMLLNFSAKSSKEAMDSVSRTLLTSTEGYGERFLNQLDNVAMVGKTVGAMLENEGTEDSARVTELLEIAAGCSGADQVIYCGMDGKAVDQTGAELDVGQEAWFEEVCAGEYPYTYVQSEQSVVVAQSVAGDEGTAQGYVISFYPMGRFTTMLLKSGYDSASFLAIVDMDGNVLGASGATTNSCVKDGNIYSAVEKENRQEVKTLRGRLNNGSRGSVQVRVGKQQFVLISAPLVEQHWGIVLGVSKSYVDRQAKYLQKSTRNMIISLIIVIAVFFCIVMVINIVGKIRSNEKKKELEDKADTDLLTGLSNKLATERKIKEYMANNQSTQSMMFILDIDNFKKINDTMGHAFGDEVLRSLGTQIGAIFRASDIVGRVGGDEFMVFLKDIGTEEAIMKEAKKVENFFKGFQAGEYVKYKATASIGVAIFPQEGNDFETLYKAADQGLYKAKKRGKNQLAFYRDRESAEQNTESDVTE